MKPLGLWLAELLKFPLRLMVASLLGVSLGITGLKYAGFTLRREELQNDGLFHWDAFISSFGFQLNQMFLPLVLASLVAYAHSLENERGGWKLCLVQPPSRTSLFFVKLSLLLIWALALVGLLGLGYVMFGVLLFPAGDVPWKKIWVLGYSGFLFLAPVILAQNALSLLVPHPLGALGPCLCGLVAAALAKGAWRWCLPWYYGAFMGVEYNSMTWVVFARCALVCAILVLGGWWMFLKKEFP